MQNRLGQPIPEKCPLSEALVWLINGILPASQDMLNAINEPSIVYSQIKYANGLPLGEADRGILLPYAYNNHGQREPLNSASFSLAEQKLIAALLNKEIRAWGIYDNNAQNGYKYEEHPSASNSAWNDFHNEIEPLLTNRNTIEIPNNLWKKRLSQWDKNALNSPHRAHVRFYDITISARDLFNKFSDNKALKNIFEAAEPNEKEQRIKRGRPRTVEKELWLEELVILYMSGVATQEDNIESLTSSLKATLSDNHDKEISDETVRKDWLRPLFKEVRKRNGEK